MELCDEMNSSAHDFGTIGFLDYFTIFYDFYPKFLAFVDVSTQCGVDLDIFPAFSHFSHRYYTVGSHCPVYPGIGVRFCFRFLTSVLGMLPL